MSQDLTDDQLRAFQKAFDHFDTNNDGTININELGAVMKAMGKDPTDEELKDMIDNVDMDGNSVIDFQEFLAMMGHQQSTSDSDAELKHVFAIFDKNGDGYISKSELKSAMKKLNEQVTDAEVDQLIVEADLDDDGEVNFHEFVTIMNKKYGSK